MKVTITFEDADDDQVAIDVTFDPSIESLKEDERGAVLLSPAVVLADVAYSAAASVPELKSVGCACSDGECPCKS